MKNSRKLISAVLALCLSLLIVLPVCGAAKDSAALLADGMRKKMISRQTEIPVSVTVSLSEIESDEAFSSYTDEFFDEIIRLTTVHDGTLKGGDYLKKQIDTYDMGASVTYSPGDDTADILYTFNITYFTTAKQEAALDAAVDKALNEMALEGRTDYEKIKAVYDYICSHVKYDYINLNNPAYPLKYSAYAAMVKGTAVCQGYASLFYLFMQRLGIDCRIITGASMNEGHAWNIVKLGGSYYNCDTTWDAGVSPANYEFFLRGKADFPDHAADKEFLTSSFQKKYPIAASAYQPSSAAVVSLSKAKFVYTGVGQKPAVIVKNAAGKTVSAKYYTVTWSSAASKAVGKYTVTVAMKSPYKGSKTLSYSIVPKQVTGLKNAGAATKSIKLSWAKTTGAKYYQVYAKNTAGAWKRIATVSGNAFTVQKIDGVSLAPGKTYSFKVRALDGTKKLIGAFSAALKTGTKTVAPRITKLTSAKSKTATVTWGKVTGAKSYAVYRSADNKTWTKAGTTTGTSFTLTGLTGGKRIYVKIRAVNAYKTVSAASAVKYVTVKK